MKSLVVCIFLLLTIFTRNAYTAKFVGKYNDPKNPGKCTITENVILSPGEIVKDPSGACVSVICGDDGSAQFHSCGVVAALDGCELGDYKDESLPYPECCERHVICDQEDKI